MSRESPHDTAKSSPNVPRSGGSSGLPGPARRACRRAGPAAQVPDMLALTSCRDVQLLEQGVHVEVVTD